MTPAIHHDVFGSTDVGRRRRNNEDRFLIARLQRAAWVSSTNVDIPSESWVYGQPEGDLIVVADGMGGMGGGDKASEAATAAILDYVCNAMTWTVPRAAVPSLPEASLEMSGTAASLGSAVLAGHAQVTEVAKQRGNPPQMGTTLTMVLVRWPNAYVAHVGDSRAYLVRGGIAHRETTDHTVGEQMRMAGAKDIEPFANILWNALGAGGDGKVVPELRKIQLEPHDVLVVCSDGLTKHVTDEELVQIISAGETSEAICNALVAAANAAGGSDNITVTISRFLPVAPVA